MANASGMLGGFIEGAEVTDETSDFYAYFNLIARDTNYFDAELKLNKTQSDNFDGKVIVYVDEQKPDVNIILPTGDVTQALPLTLDFEAQASGLNSKHIVFTAWYFTDAPTTSGSNLSTSGTYTTSHTYVSSGVFTAMFVAVDDQGLVNTDRVTIDTTDGASVPTITLEATPESGTAPHSVEFTSTVVTDPYPIVESYLMFGDGTKSASTGVVTKIYPVIGCYLPTLRVRDSRGFIITDTILIGVNN